MSTDNAVLHELLAGASIEATPRWVIEQPSLDALLPPGTQVYLPNHAGVDGQATVGAVAALAAAGLCPVPHLPVRAIRSTAEMRERLLALAFAGADTLLLIAGDDDRPTGPYANTLDLLESGLLAEHGFYKLGVAGHPEGHRRVSDAELVRMLAAKRDYAVATGSVMWVVTQFVFSADSVLAWLHRVREAIHPLPVRVGLPGPTGLSTLIRYATRCGVGASARFLARRTSSVRLLGGWSPEAVVRELADQRASPDGPLFSGVHFFPFGGVTRYAEWVTGLRTSTSEREGGAELLQEPTCTRAIAAVAGAARSHDLAEAGTARWAMTESEQ